MAMFNRYVRRRLLFFRTPVFGPSFEADYILDLDVIRQLFSTLAKGYPRRARVI
jgi:hypothetical protein